MRSTLKWTAVGAVGLLAATLGACTSGGNTEGEDVTIRFAQFGNSLDDPTGMANDPIKKAIEDAVGITLEYDTGAEGFDDRMLTELATGTGPDLFPTWGETDKITSWIEDGAVVNMAEIVNGDPGRYPTLAKMFASDGYRAYSNLYSGDPDAVYAIYAIAALPQPSFGGVPVYNQAILDQVNGGKVPTTVDEFIDFTNAAAAAGYAGWWPRNDKLTNWNEIDRTIALPQGTSIAPPADQPWTGSFEVSDDTWKLATTSEKSKEVVKQLRDMYAANALDSGVGVQGDFDDAYAAFGLGELASANFQFGYAGQFRDFWKAAWQQANPDTAKVSDLAQGVSLQGSAGYPQIAQTSGWMGAHWFIPATAEHPDRVLDLLEFLASTKGQDLLFKGIPGETYNEGADGLPEYVEGAWNSINKAYGTEDGRGKYVWFDYLFSAASFMTEFETTDWLESVTHPVDYSEQWMSELDIELTNTAQSVIDTFVNDVIVPLPEYYNMVVLPQEAQDIRTALKEVSNRYLAAMVGGQMDIDAEWANYQAEFEAAGASQYEEMLNQAIKDAKALAG